MPELKTCPFCGAVPAQPDCYRTDAHPSWRGKWGWVECTACGARSGDVRTGYESIVFWGEHAATEWNKRA